MLVDVRLGSRQQLMLSGADEGEGPDGELHAYILDDRSLRSTPNGVMQAAAAAFRKWDAEPKGWAAVYAPRESANNMDRVAAMLRQYGEGNFGGARPSRTPGLARIWRKGLQ